ncbi:hypothetical protein CMI47_15720 [Candidatus Pacearchaeota archaeon]|nr:hypothetical protein [Candidatus Pacearchaeota archaeon]
MTGKYKKQWEDYFEGGIAMWSHYGYQYHSNLITKHILPLLDIPSEGHIVQIGTGLGIATETLCTLFGSRRVVGYDLFNPLHHPNIYFLDTHTTIPPLTDLAYLEIDIGSMSDARSNRKLLLEWALTQMKIGGYILTNRKLAIELQAQGIQNFKIIDLSQFDIPELWTNVYETRLNTKVILKVIDKQ